MTELIHNIEHEDYLAWPEIGQSKLKQILTSEHHLEKEFSETESMKLGTAFHSAILTPDDGRWMVAPEINRRTKAGKEDWANFVDMAGDAVVLTKSQGQDLDAMVASVRANSTAMAILERVGDVEVSVKIDVEGIPMKARADALGSTFVLDLKSTKCAAPRDFYWSCVKYGYDIQASHYLKSFDKERFIIVATENMWPFITEVYELSPEMIIDGMEKYRRAIDKYLRYKETGKKYGYTGRDDIFELKRI